MLTTKKMRTTKPFSILDELLASPPIHNTTNTGKSTTSSTTTHPLYCIITTTVHSIISTTNPTLALRHQPCATILNTSTTTPPPPHTSHNTSFSPIHPHPPSTTTVKSKFTPFDTQSKQLPLTFHFIPSHPNYISKLKLPMHITKLCSDIQHNAQLSVIKIIEEHPSKQNKHKKIKKKSEATKKPITSNQGFNPYNILSLHLPILLQTLTSPPICNTTH